MSPSERAARALGAKIPADVDEVRRELADLRERLASLERMRSATREALRDWRTSGSRAVGPMLARIEAALVGSALPPIDPPTVRIVRERPGLEVDDGA